LRFISLAMSDDEKKKLQDYIQQKRQQHEEIFSHDKRLRDEQDRIRKDKFKKLNEQISSGTKRTSAFTPVCFAFFVFVFILFIY
jgi:hypothetical protein